MKRGLLLVLFFGFSTTVNAALRSQMVTYKQGKTVLEGYLTYDDAVQGKRPGVLVVHEWLGLNDNAKMHADKLARLGYVAFAADIYGKGQVTMDTKVAGEWSKKYKSDRKLMRERVSAGLETLKKQALVDPSKTAAIGFCFGGTCVLELARSGADVNGVVSFHGSLNTPVATDAKNIKGKVLVLHGADDPNVKPEEVAAFEQEMRDAKTDWQLVSYGNAVHGFTNPSGGNDNSKGYAYNEKAATRSWKAMQDLFDEIFK